MLQLHTQEEKNIITQKAKDKGISVNEFIKRIILEDDSKADSTDNINDSNNDIGSVAKFFNFLYLL
ncbi:plasmid mobilization protein [Lactococcus lactis]|uniref:plasmid mobilization protein n=1 Tax=Lactococcus lactis TaxID=1358 RepID=UPI00356B6477